MVCILPSLFVAVLIFCQILIVQASLRGSNHQAKSATGIFQGGALVERVLAEKVLLTPGGFKETPITEAECTEVDTVLAQGGEAVSIYRDFWGLICEDPELRKTLSELKDGCLYVPTNAHLSKFIEAVGRFNTNYFAQVFENQFFFGECPTRRSDTKHTSAGGDTVRTCEAGQVGFVGVDGKCIAVEALGHTSLDTFNLTLMTVEGNLGLTHEWHEGMKFRGVNDEVAEEVAESSESDRHLLETNRSLQALNIMPTPIVIPTTFIICDGPSGDVTRQVTEAQLEQQVAVLNADFNGESRCSHSLHYEPHYADAKMFFRYDGFSTVLDDRCATQCREHFSSIRSAYAPSEAGKLKVLICGLNVLGVSSTGQSPAIRADTLPGGSSRHFNMGKTLTHELGHSFDLRHTFHYGCSDNSDQVADTNDEESAAIGCPHRTTCGSLDPVHNFMDYSYDECMCSFSRGQRDRMLNYITNSAIFRSFIAPVADQGPCSCCNPNRCCPGGGCPCNGRKNAEFVTKYDQLLTNPTCLASRLQAVGKDPSHYTNVPSIGGQCCTEECFSMPSSQWNTRWPGLPYMRLDFSPCP